MNDDDWSGRVEAIVKRHPAKFSSLHAGLIGTACVIAGAGAGIPSYRAIAEPGPSRSEFVAVKQELSRCQLDVERSLAVGTVNAADIKQSQVQGATLGSQYASLLSLVTDMRIDVREILRRGRR